VGHETEEGEQPPLASMWIARRVHPTDDPRYTGGSQGVNEKRVAGAPMLGEVGDGVAQWHGHGGHHRAPDHRLAAHLPAQHGTTDGSAEAGLSQGVHRSGVACGVAEVLCQVTLPEVEDPLQLAPHEQEVGEPSQRAEGKTVVNDVLGLHAVLNRMESMRDTRIDRTQCVSRRLFTASWQPAIGNRSCRGYERDGVVCSPNGTQFNILSRSGARLTFVSGCFLDVLHRMKSCPQNEELWGPCHLDLDIQNCLRIPGDISPIDFDASGLAFFAFDIALVLEGYPPKLREIFLSSYQKRRRLAEDIQQLLETFILMYRLREWINRADLSHDVVRRPDNFKWAPEWVSREFDLYVAGKPFLFEQDPPSIA